MNDSALYILGYNKIKTKFPLARWKVEWFPTWFFDIKDSQEKVCLPDAGIRLEYLLFLRNCSANRINKEELEKQLEELRNRKGISGILDGSIPAYLTNFKDFSQYTKNHLGEIWGKVLATDNYGKIIKQNSKNEFNTDLIKKLSNHLDIKLLEWYDKEEWFKDIWSDLEREYWDILKKPELAK